MGGLPKSKLSVTNTHLFPITVAGAAQALNLLLNYHPQSYGAAPERRDRSMVLLSHTNLGFRLCAGFIKDHNIPR